MRKSFMNIKNFVDSNVIRHRIDKTTNSSDPINDDLALVERQFDDLRQLCVEAEKRISNMLQSINSSTLGTYTQNVQASLSNLSQLTVNQAVPASQSTSDQLVNSSKTNFTNSSGLNTIRAHSAQTACNRLQQDGSQSADGAEFDIRKQHKKLPIVGFLKFLVKSCHKLRQDSLLATTLTHCSQLQAQLTKLYLSYERTIEAQCLRPIQQVLETDVPNVIRLRKSFIKAHNDLESVKSRYNGASQKQQLQQQQPLTAHSTSASYTITQNSTMQANINKLDLLKKELYDAETRFEQAKDAYAIELYTFVCRETELMELFMEFYQHQADYQAQASSLIRNSLPSLRSTLDTTPRRVIFGTPLVEQLRCTSRSLSVLVELCVHLLYSNALNEEGLFRIPGSSIKIKKLKSAINAWFVTLAAHNELSENQVYEISQRQYKTTNAQQSTSQAIYNLFKDIVGQRPSQHQALLACSEANHSNQIVPTTATTRDESAQTFTDSHAPDQDSNKIVFDVHTVAGLLKLYLRELPEPLLVDALYGQWVDACARRSEPDKPESVVYLKRVVEQLPKANYDNLRLLIRFLHLLTCHHEKNKMTATNLAITMAPSLIWCPKDRQLQLDSGASVGNNNQQIDDAQALNMQMSSMGISASLHALIVENLINHAEQLFPGEIEFALSTLDAEPVPLTSYGRRVQNLAKERSVKSTSPTGSSTESSSSFSSNSNTSSCKKSGSTDQLANATCDNASHVPRRPTRPQSVHINQIESKKESTKPPVPPAPAIRSHTRQSSDSVTSVRRFASRKPPAPPIPFQSASQKLPEAVETSRLSDDIHVSMPSDAIRTSDSYANPENLTQRSSRPASLRGTGIAPTTQSGTDVCTIPTRPSVPPPDRPHDQTDSRLSIKSVTLTNGNVGGLGSPSSFRSEFEEINALDIIGDIDVHISPVVSLDSASGDDSSFDNQSLDQSWTECDSDKDKGPQTDGSIEDTGVTHTESEPAISPELCEAQAKDTPKIDSLPETHPANNPAHLAPTKPPRNSSPKTNAPSVMQSTLL